MSSSYLSRQNITAMTVLQLIVNPDGVAIVVALNAYFFGQATSWETYSTGP